MKTVEFIKKHTYGGVSYEKGEQIVIPQKRAVMLRKAKAAKVLQASKAT